MNKQTCVCGCGSILRSPILGVRTTEERRFTPAASRSLFTQEWAHEQNEKVSFWSRFGNSLIISGQPMWHRKAEALTELFREEQRLMDDIDNACYAGEEELIKELHAQYTK